MVSFVVLVAIILVVGFFVYRVLANFLPPLFLAGLMVVIFRPLHQWMLEKTGNRHRLAAGLTTAAITLIVVLPTAGVTYFAVREGADLVTNFDSDEVRPRLTELRQRFGVDLPGAKELSRIHQTLLEMLADIENAKTPQQWQILEKEQLRLDSIRQALTDAGEDETQVASLETAILEVARTKAGTLENENAIYAALREIRIYKEQLLGDSLHVWIADLVNPSDQRKAAMNRSFFGWLQRAAVSVSGDVAGAIGRFVVGLIIMIISIFFFFADGPKMVRTLMKLFPLDDRYEEELLLEFDKVSRAVVLSHLLSALAQAILAGVGFYFVGVDAVFLLVVLTFTLAMIPFVGAASVWAPVALYGYFVDERALAASLLALWGAVGVSMVDNFIKPYILHGRSKLHPLLALLSVLGGVQALGPIGILIGPMVVVFLSTLLKILHRELTHFDGTTDGDILSSPGDVAGS